MRHKKGPGNRPFAAPRTGLEPVTLRLTADAMGVRSGPHRMVKRCEVAPDALRSGGVGTKLGTKFQSGVVEAEADERPRERAFVVGHRQRRRWRSRTLMLGPLRWRAVNPPDAARTRAHLSRVVAYWFGRDRGGIRSRACPARGRRRYELAVYRVGNRASRRGAGGHGVRIGHYRELQAALREEREPHTSEGFLVALAAVGIAVGAASVLLVLLSP